MLWDGHEIALSSSAGSCAIGIRDRVALLRLVANPSLQFGRTVLRRPGQRGGQPGRVSGSALSGAFPGPRWGAGKPWLAWPTAHVPIACGTRRENIFTTTTTSVTIVYKLWH